MRCLGLIALPLGLQLSAFAVDYAAPKPPPAGWPTESYAAILDRSRDADLAVFEIGARKIFVTERAWLDALQNALVTDHAKPDARCFCASDASLKLFAKDRLLCSLSLTHDNKVRFSSGDFILPEETHAALRKLWAIALKAESYAPPKKSTQHAKPPRVELKP